MTTRVEARACEQGDFGFAEKQIYHYTGWWGFSLVCPELKEGDGFKIKGDSASMVTQSY